MIFQARQGDTLDSLIYRHYGETAGWVEIALDFNPIAAMQPVLNAGQKIIMPENQHASAAYADTINLWD